MADQLWKKAQNDLCIEIPGAPADPFVWEHSGRVAKLVEAIVALPELANHVMDRSALLAASLYHDAGWILQVRAGELSARELLLRPTSDRQRELAADWITDQLVGIVAPGVLRLAARSIRQCNDRQTNLLEAQILAEAENLDEIGPQAIYPMLRKQLAEGKTLADTVAAWRRQEEYHYWQARIKECFRFPSVRALAEQRWRLMARFMDDLQAAVRLEDLVLQHKVVS